MPTGKDCLIEVCKIDGAFQRPEETTQTLRSADY